MKKHLLISVIISVFCYLVTSIAQGHLDIKLYSEGARQLLAFLIFGCNIAYYVNRYLDGDFTEK